MQEIDTLLEAAWILPVEPDDSLLENHAIAIHNGRILEILPAVDARNRYQANSSLRLPSHILTPGFINAHTHASMSLLRGLADDLPLMDWLQNHIWPVESRFIGPEFIKDGTRLAIAEMIRSGTTCFNDMYFFPEVTAQVAIEAGIRAVVGLIVLDFPSAWATDADDYINKGLEVNDRFRDESLVTTAFAPHAPYTVSDQPLQRVQVLVNELEIPIHMHVHETVDEINQSIENFGMRPIERLKQLGLLTPGLLAVHMTQLTDSEISDVAESGAHVVHCPESNLKLASGFCPVGKLLQAGVNVALGTDGTASNNDLDMCGEMKTAALLAKAVAGNARTLPAMQAIEMVTINAARALGIEHETGSLLAGKSADIVAFNLDSIETRPLYCPISQLVYAGGRDKVTDVWINGQHLLNRGELTRMDLKEILERTHGWQQRIKRSDDDVKQ
ncbi:MAG TPA: TRZ/ATZ family hydrolase [Gammaproteobacteria bacterium]|nr:TRZ/ATZ family hydrolase [Gammaproteobacteria bacterium]